LAAVTQQASVIGQVYNIAFGTSTTLNELFSKLRMCLEPHFPSVAHLKPQYQEFRKGDILHSLADISKAKELLNYSPSHSLDQGLAESIDWYLSP
jgi:UDP-N-acetylglucosamine 4-epimerase